MKKRADLPPPLTWPEMRRICVVAVSALTCGVTVFRIHHLGPAAVDWMALSYLVIAAVMVIFADASKLRVTQGKDGAWVLNVSNADQEAIRRQGVGGKRQQLAVRALAEAADMSDLAEAAQNDDPLATKPWLVADQGKRMSAIIEPVESMPGCARVTLRVTADDGATPLADRTKVTFLLHPTFKEPSRDVYVSGGVAELIAIAWGTFTAGAIVEGGPHLKIDLQSVKGGPTEFYLR